MPLQLQNLRILYVDDQDTVRTLFQRYLHQLGINDLHEAENGKDALAILEKFHAAGTPIDLIFCDWNMPLMNGLQLLTTVRKDPKLMKLPFVMVTVNSDETEVVEAMRSGVSEYLVKPFDTRSLQRSIERVLAAAKKIGPKS